MYNLEDIKTCANYISSTNYSNFICTIMSRMQLFFVIIWWYILSFNGIVGELKDVLIEDSVNITTDWYFTADSVQSHEIVCNTCKALPRQAYIVVDNGHSANYYKFTAYEMDKLVLWAASYVWHYASQDTDLLQETKNIDLYYKGTGHFGRFEDKIIKGVNNVGVYNIRHSVNLVAAIKHLADLNGYGNARNKDEWLNGGQNRLKRFQFGNYIVEIETYFFYARLVGRIRDSNKEIYEIPEYYCKKVWNQFHMGMIDYIKNYNPFSTIVLNWLNGGNPNCHDNDERKKLQCAFTAQLAIALFISEPTRNFRVHITNMMSLDRFYNNDGLTVADFLENHPMARGKTWPIKTENGMNYKRSEEDNNSERKAIREGVEERIRNIIFDWCHLFRWTIPHDINVRYKRLLTRLEKGTYSCIINNSDNIKDRGSILSSGDATQGIFKLLTCYTYILGKFGPVIIHSQTHYHKELVEQEINECFKF